MAKEILDGELDGVEGENERILKKTEAVMRWQRCLEEQICTYHGRAPASLYLRRFEGEISKEEVKEAGDSGAKSEECEVGEGVGDNFVDPRARARAYEAEELGAVARQVESGAGRSRGK